MTDNPTAVPVHYFIYYRVRKGIDRDDAHAAIREMQAALSRRTGVAGRLMERHHDDSTWMEIYESVTDPDAFEASLHAEAGDHRFDELIEPGTARHMERFVECA